MKILSTFKNTAKQFAVKATLVAAVTGAVLAGSFMASKPASAATGYNCDANAVIWCGASSTSVLNTKYDKADGHNSATSIHNIYSYFGISGSDVDSMSKNAVNGSVTKTGDVIVAGKVVATNALTAGRQNISGSTKVSSNGSTFYTRKPSVSFQESSLPAMVQMKDGVFQFAILNSCGNPVKATPKTPPKTPTPTTPNDTIVKQVRAKGSTAYTSDVTVQSGATAQYKISVASTGTATAKNVTVHDVLPVSASYVANTLKVTLVSKGVQQGQIAVPNPADFFAKGVVIPTLGSGDTYVFTFDAVIGQKDTATICKAETITNTGFVTATDVPSHSSSANVKKTCAPAPTPTYTCTDLTAAFAANDTFTSTFKASASVTNGAVITSYVFNFGDGKTTTVTSKDVTASTAHTYEDGTYSAFVTVNFMVNGKAQTASGDACKTTVAVKPAPITPTAQCTGLTATPAAGNIVSVVPTYTATGGATLKSISYDFGDKTAAVVATTTAAQTHTYTKADTYNIVATLSFTATPAVANSTCKAVVTFTAPQPVYTCDLFTISQDANRNVAVTAFNTTQTNGATFTKADITWGDQSAVTSTPTPVGQTHQYAAPAAGTSSSYNLSVIAHFMVNGQDVTNAGKCVATVSFSAPETPSTPTPPVTPPTTPTPTPQVLPATLVNTGAGSVIGIFAATAIVATVAHRLFLSRKLSRR